MSSVEEKVEDDVPSLTDDQDEEEVDEDDDDDDDEDDDDGDDDDEDQHEEKAVSTNVRNLLPRCLNSETELTKLPFPSTGRQQS